MNTKDSRLFFVGDWLASPDENTLSREGEVRHLEPLAMAVLVYLASRPGDVISRADLEENVWRGSLVGYDAVTNTVIKLRKALDDKARSPSYIATVPKRGYQLIAQVSQAPVDMPAADSPQQAKPTQPGWRSRSALVAGMFIVVLAGLIFWLAHNDRQALPHSKAGIAPSIVVLPFENLSDDPSQDTFANGMTEDLITDLSGISGVRVIASNTAFSYQGRSRSPQQIQADLGVDYLLEGSVRRHGESLRINAQLVDARDAFQVWAHRFDTHTRQTFAVQDELTSQIVKALAVQLSPQEQSRLAAQTTNNLLAYDFFQEAQRLSKINTRDTLREAQATYRKAIEADPSYGRAYGAIAYTLAFAYRRGWSDNPMQDIERAFEMAQRGVQLNPDIPQTYWSLGYVHLMRKEFDKAKQAVQMSLSIAPNFADGYGLLALIHNGLGEAQAAIANIRKGMQLNPFYTWDYPYNLGRANYLLGNYQEAVDHLEQAKARNPNAMPIRKYLAASYLRSGRTDDAEWEVEEIQTINPHETLSHLSDTFASNHKESMQRLLDDLRAAGLPE